MINFYQIKMHRNYLGLTIVVTLVLLTTILSCGSGPAVYVPVAVQTERQLQGPLVRKTRCSLRRTCPPTDFLTDLLMELPAQSGDEIYVLDLETGQTDKIRYNSDLVRVWR